jgi:uncharacterized protein YhbP (UPF0306 family)
MKDVKALIQTYLKDVRVMQLATCVNNRPWACNVHFYMDDDLNLYWISTPLRRHSQEIAQNPYVAATIKVHEDTPTEKYIIGITFEGKAEQLSNDEIGEVGEQYITKLKKDPSLLSDLQSGKNPHKFYKLMPENIVVFDTKNFADAPRQEYHLI